MKCETALPLSIAAVSLFLLFPQIGQARSVEGRNLASATVTQSAAPIAGENEAKLMVPAQGVLVQRVDARKMQPGQQFRVKLSDTIQLKSGPELPNGTDLVGTIVTDHMKVNGTSRLALRFTQAKLKDGTVVPIKATIVEVLPPDYGYWASYGYQNLKDIWNARARPGTGAFSDPIWQNQFCFRDQNALMMTVSGSNNYGQN